MTERQTAAPNLGSSTEQAQPAPSALRSGEMIALLAGITALGPFAMQALAPAIPGLGRSLEVSPAEAQLFLSLSTLAMAAGAVLYGPLADYYGRRPIILGGLVLAFVGATIAVLSPGYTMALVGRMVQSVGAATGMILARAVAVDRHGREGAAPVIAQMTAYMVVAPMLAP
ncbi:MAG: MFS transporter, partial [Pseudomonadota bacterium]